MSLLSLFICYNNIMDISGDILFLCRTQWAAVGTAGFLKFTGRRYIWLRDTRTSPGTHAI